MRYEVSRLKARLETNVQIGIKIEMRIETEVQMLKQIEMRSKSDNATEIAAVTKLRQRRGLNRRSRLRKGSRYVS